MPTQVNAVTRAQGHQERDSGEPKARCSHNRQSDNLQAILTNRYIHRGFLPWRVPPIPTVSHNVRFETVTSGLPG
jgi:hypothetical protein